MSGSSDNKIHKVEHENTDIDGEERIEGDCFLAHWIKWVQLISIKVIEWWTQSIDKEEFLLKNPILH